jgi:hypothetical protein
VPLHPEEEDGSGESEQEDADNNAYIPPNFMQTYTTLLLINPLVFYYMRIIHW